MLNKSTIYPLFIYFFLFGGGGGGGGAGYSKACKKRERALKSPPREGVAVAGKFYACSRFLLALLS